MPGTIDAKLAELGLTLPEPAAPLANYVGYNVVGNLVVVSGQIPLVDGQIAVTGKVGVTATVEQAQQAARICFLNLLAQLKAAAGGDLDRVARVVRLGGFIAAPPEFHGHAQVMNGASDLCVEIFGDKGRHARTTVGVPSLPGNATVEVEGMFELAPVAGAAGGGGRGGRAAARAALSPEQRAERKAARAALSPEQRAERRAARGAAKGQKGEARKEKRAARATQGKGKGRRKAPEA